MTMQRIIGSQLACRNYISGKFEPGAVSATVEVPTGTYSSASGLNYLQISREGAWLSKNLRMKQRCHSGSGAGKVLPITALDRASRRRTRRIHFSFDGIDISLAGIGDLASRSEDHAFLTKGLGTINGLVEEAIHTYSIGDPDKIADTLAKGFGSHKRACRRSQEQRTVCESKIRRAA